MLLDVGVLERRCEVAANEDFAVVNDGYFVE